MDKRMRVKTRKISLGSGDPEIHRTKWLIPSPVISFRDKAPHSPAWTPPAGPSHR